MVMARDFWFKRLESQAIRRSVSFTAIHPSPPDSAGAVERFWRQHKCRAGPEAVSKSIRRSRIWPAVLIGTVSAFSPFNG